MDKKTKTIVIVVVAVVVLGGVFYGFNRWRQQRLANQILAGMYGVNTGLFGGLTGGGNIQEQIAKEMAKEVAKDEAQQKADEAKEAAKTPADRYNETEEMATYDDNSKAAVNEVKDILEKVFGKAKLTSISVNAYGSENSGGYSIMEFKIARLAAGEDLSALNKAFTDKGLQIMQSSMQDKSAGVVAGDNGASYSIGFEIGEQTVSATVIKTNE